MKTLKSARLALLIRRDLDVLDDTSVQGLLETGILTSKVFEVDVALFALEGLGVRHRGVKGGLLTRHCLVGGRQEDDLAVGRLGHGLHSLEVADLHGGC